MKPSRKAATRKSERPEATAAKIEKQAKERFGVLPNFFRLSPETPEITAKLWGFAEAAYLDNPLPSLFKERLFVYLSRFCAVRYCTARHVGFLVGLGRPAGDSRASVSSVEDVVRLLQRKVPADQELKARLADCAQYPSPLGEMPAVDSPCEEAIFALTSHIFLQTSNAPACQDVLERLLGPIHFEFLILLITFIRAAHFWTEVHPELEFEDDIKSLLTTHEALAACIHFDYEGSGDTVGRALLGELPALRREAERASSLLAAIVDSSEDAVVSKTLNGVITSWNRGAETIFGYNASEAIGNPITMIIPEDKQEEEIAILERIREGERIEHFDTVRVHKDGHKVDISLTISPIRDKTGNVTGASKVARDVTQRKQIDRELRESEGRYRALANGLETQVEGRTQELRRRNTEVSSQADQLRVLSLLLMHAQDAERRHIARELHDSAGQTLTALGIRLASLFKATHDPTKLTKGIEEAESLVRHLSDEIRTTSYLLHPPMLDEVGVASALQWYIQGLAERSGLLINLQVPKDFGRLPGDSELVVFRFVQECLTNVHRHSKSKTAHIKVYREGEHVRMEVRDRGRGMSAERLAAIRSSGSGLGIMGLRERLRHIGGELNIESTTLGTSVTASFPVEPSAAAKQIGLRPSIP